MNKRNIAFHESAHAVTCYLLGIGIVGIEITQEVNKPLSHFEGRVLTSQAIPIPQAHQAIAAFSGQFGHQIEGGIQLNVIMKSFLQNDRRLLNKYGLALDEKDASWLAGEIAHQLPRELITPRDSTPILSELYAEIAKDLIAAAQPHVALIAEKLLLVNPISSKQHNYQGDERSIWRMDGSEVEQLLKEQGLKPIDHIVLKQDIFSKFVELCPNLKTHIENEPEKFDSLCTPIQVQHPAFVN